MNYNESSRLFAPIVGVPTVAVAVERTGVFGVGGRDVAVVAAFAVKDGAGQDGRIGGEGEYGKSGGKI